MPFPSRRQAYWREADSRSRSSGDYNWSRRNPRLVVSLKNWRNNGGVNWWYEEKRLAYLPFGRQPELDDKWLAYEQGHATGKPVILEPSYYKYSDPTYELLRPQWDYFVARLLDTDAVIILGYSLPEADIEARRALTLGFQGNQDSQWLVIDKQEWVCDRYKRLFGERRLRTYCGDIGSIGDQALEIIAQSL